RGVSKCKSPIILSFRGACDEESPLNDRMIGLLHFDTFFVFFRNGYVFFRWIRGFWKLLFIFEH
ncbi:MAG TPA: hypothetical protein DD464_11360, partial [Bacteroides sp.]|nr:hypothetical protein [Bacteroides sp.]